ncbi:hypothetical protein [Alteromonas sp. ASW11-130]|uniref:hypothetical protein n=1 Tax=Alteromonas sp. ASW11-130 TaxID=3015775 RepID=UPI0022425074|nr:hypothetical protein [Alteromonas sp. ASW11-130]MCW8090205.1 hypothetical protein [Alteromonas sp. ASW11-130]
MKNYLTIAMILFAIFNVSSALAVDCNRGKIDKVFFTFPKNNEPQINIFFTDGKGAIWKKAPHHLNHDNLDRMFSAAMAYKIAQRDIVVRYEHVSQCSQLDNNTTDKFIGFWLL